MASKKPAPAVSMALVSDTGISASDRITSNPAIKGAGQRQYGGYDQGRRRDARHAMASSTGAWSFIPTGLADGAHTLSATQTDPDGNTATATLSFTLDKTAPVVSIALVSDTGSSSSDRITSNPAVKGVGQANTLVTIKEGGVTLGTDDGGRHRRLELHTGRIGRRRAYTQRQPDRSRRQHRDGDAELHARQDGAGGEHRAGFGYRQLVERQDYRRTRRSRASVRPIPSSRSRRAAPRSAPRWPTARGPGALRRPAWPTARIR